MALGRGLGVNQCPGKECCRQKGTSNVCVCCWMLLAARVLVGELIDPSVLFWFGCERVCVRVLLFARCGCHCVAMQAF